MPSEKKVVIGESWNHFDVALYDRRTKHVMLQYYISNWYPFDYIKLAAISKSDNSMLLIFSHTPSLNPLSVLRYMFAKNQLIVSNTTHHSKGRLPIDTCENIAKIMKSLFIVKWTGKFLCLQSDNGHKITLSFIIDMTSVYMTLNKTT